MSVNKAVLLGNLGSDPRVKVFKDNNKLVTLSIATNSVWIDKKTNMRREVTDWHTVQLRNKIAGVAEKYLKKGDKIYVKGTIRTRHYINHKGEKHKRTEVIGKSLQLISGKVTQSRLDEAGVKIKDVEANASHPVSIATPESVVEKAEASTALTDNTTASEPVAASSGQDCDTPIEQPKESENQSIDNSVPFMSNTEATEPEVLAEAPVIEHTDLAKDKVEINPTTPDDLNADEGDAVDVSATDDGKDSAITDSADDDEAKEVVAAQEKEFTTHFAASNPYDDIPYNTEDVDSSDFLDLDAYYDINESLQFADSHLSLLADEFNREALEAQQQDSAVDADEDLPDWLLP